MLTPVICIKIIGTVCIVSGCFGIGWSAGMTCRKRYRQLDMLRQMMLLLRGEIRYAKTELPEAFYHVSMRLPQPFSDFLTELSEAMKAMDGQPMYVLWGEYIDRKLSGSCLSADDLEAFKMLGRHLGFLDQDMQLAAIDMYTESLDTTMAALRQSLGQKQKTSLCLGILSGFFLSVLLL